MILALATVSVAANLEFEEPRLPNWVGVNTGFGIIRPPEELSAAEYVQKAALDTDARVIVFPERVVRRWTHSTDLFWQPTLDKLHATGRTILIGAGLFSPNSPYEYRNAVIIRGADGAPIFEQRIPVPLAMWKPWGGKDHVPLKVFGPPTVNVAGERAAILICYEQLLPWSYLTALWQKPTVIVGMSNAYWTKVTVIPKYQDACLRAWGRVFGKPVISATNY